MLEAVVGRVGLDEEVSVLLYYVETVRGRTVYVERRRVAFLLLEADVRRPRHLNRTGYICIYIHTRATSDETDVGDAEGRAVEFLHVTTEDIVAERCTGKTYWAVRIRNQSAVNPCDVGCNGIHVNRFVKSCADRPWLCAIGRSDDHNRIVGKCIGADDNPFDI